MSRPVICSGKHVTQFRSRVRRTQHRLAFAVASLSLTFYALKRRVGPVRRRIYDVAIRTAAALYDSRAKPNALPFPTWRTTPPTKIQPFKMKFSRPKRSFSEAGRRNFLGYSLRSIFIVYRARGRSGFSSDARVICTLLDSIC